MNLRFYFEKLETSEVFKNFMKAHPDAFLCSGFFIFDKTGKEKDNQHFDFYSPSGNKLESFQLENMQLVPIDMLGALPNKLDLDIDFDFEEIEKMIEKKMESEGIKNKIQKVLFSLQNIDGKNLLLGTVFISMLGLIKVNIDLKENRIVEFEKKSLLDIIKVSKKK